MQALAKPKGGAVDAILAMGLSTPAPVLSAGTAALLSLGAQQRPRRLRRHRLPDRRRIRNGIHGELSTWNLEDADLIGVLRLIQDISGLNMVIEPGISGKVNL